MNPVMAYPDAEKVIIDYLNTQLTPPVRADIPNPRPAVFARVLRTGGPSEVVTDRPQITVEAWAASRTAAQGLAQQARTEMRRLAYSTQGSVQVYRVDEVGGLINLPDPASTQFRFTQTFTVSLRGTPA